MTSWKDHKEHRTPFLSRGMGRTTQLEAATAQLEERVDRLENQSATTSLIAFVDELPQQPAPDTIYFICFES